MLLVFSALLVAVQTISFLAVTSAASNHARLKGEGELDTGQRTFRQMLDQNAAQLAQAARVLSADFGFREAIATQDIETIASALQNSGTRIGADVTLYVGLDGRVEAHSGEDNVLNGQPFPLPSLIDSTAEAGRATAIDTLYGGSYQLVAVPVRAPLPIGYVVLGFRIDEQIALSLKKLTDVDVTVLKATGATPAWHAFSSTLPLVQAQASFGAMPLDAATAGSLQRVRFNGEDHQVRVLELSAPGTPQPIVAVLQRSYASAMAGFDRLRATLILLGVGALLVSVLGTSAIALNITRPIGELVKSARRITAGDYLTPVRVDRVDELGSLAQSLDEMRDGIALREAENLRLAFRDHLTGLANRSLFSNELQKALDEAVVTHAPLAVLIFDLDRFKVINDTLGYSAGDLVLYEVAQRVDALLGPKDLLARLGGNEFAILLQGHASHAAAMARRIAAALELPIQYLEQAVDLEASIGASLYPDHGREVIALLRNADVAMNAAKRKRSGLAFYDPAVDISRRQHLSLLGELRKALDNNDLCLYYQPKLALKDGTVREVESLLRWKHPQKGMIPPGDFIPFAEQTGYIRVVTRWVLREAIRQCRLWQQQGLSLRIAVNLSAADIMDRNLPDYLESLLKEHDVPPGLIGLEITESGFMEDPASAQQMLGRLADLGLQLAIDDYGTGYSSLSYLMQLPVHELKIDRSFVATMATDDDLRTIVRSTIGMGHNLGLRIVAEGVEDAAGLQALKDEGCDQAQGYFVSRPLPAAELEGWLAASGSGSLQIEALSSGAATSSRASMFARLTP